MDVNAQLVTRSNFWQAYIEFENNAWKDSFKRLRLTSSLSFCLSTIYRLIVSLSFIPSLVIFILILQDSYTNGLTETIHTLLTSLQPITKIAPGDLIKAWLALGTVVFACSWIYKPWKSPAKHTTEDLMYRWWITHGEKAPGINDG